MTFTNRQIARVIHLGEQAIRQWLWRAPQFSIGTLGPNGRTYRAEEAMTLMIAAEIMRHALARPYEALPAAQAVANARGTLWACRDSNDELSITPERPDAAVAVMIPIDLLRSRLGLTN